MDSLGDILYLLIMVGVVIFGVIKKSKTSGGGEIMPEDEVDDYPSEAFPPLSKWLEEQLDPKPKPEIVTKPRVAPVMQKEREPAVSHFKKPYKPAPRKPYQSLEDTPRIQRKIATKESFIEEEPEYGTSFLWEDEQFDLRKAVIYSEILKRPSI